MVATSTTGGCDLGPASADEDADSVGVQAETMETDSVAADGRPVENSAQPGAIVQWIRSAACHLLRWLLGVVASPGVLRPRLALAVHGLEPRIMLNGAGLGAEEDLGSLFVREFEGRLGSSMLPLYSGGMQYSSPTSVDIDADGDLDVLAGSGGYGVSGAVFFFHNAGNPSTAAWSLSSEDYAGLSIASQMHVSALKVGDLNGDGLDEVVSLSNHKHFFPSRVSVLDGSGDRVGSYWNPGHLGLILIDELDDSGTTRLVVGGMNNDLSAADLDYEGAVMWFAGDDVWGEAPSNVHERSYDLGSHEHYKMAEYCGRRTAYGHGMAADLDDDGVKEILVSSAGDGVHAYHPNTGEILWHIDKGGTAIGVLEYAPGSKAFITAGPRPDLSEPDTVHNLWALDPDGSERWSKPTPSHVDSMWIEDVHGDATDEIVVLCTDHLWVLGADGAELLKRDLSDVAGRRLALLPHEGSSRHDIGLSEDATVTVLAWDDVSLWHDLWSVDAPSDVAAMWAGDLGGGSGSMFLVGCEEGEIRGYSAQDGQGVFSASVRFEVRTMDVGNLDGSGALDLAVGTGDRDFGHVYAFDSDGNELWRVKTGDAFYRTLSWSAPAFADIDDDGSDEMFLGTWWGAVEMYDRVGQGDQAAWKLAEPQVGGLARESNSVGRFTRPALADIDGDDDYDLFVGGENGTVIFLENVGDAADPSFAAYVSDYAGANDWGGFSAPSFGDLNADGALDLIVGGGDGTVQFIANEGTSLSPTWGSPEPAYTGIDVGDAAAPHLTDTDGDGDLDLLIGSKDTGIWLLSNVGTPERAQWDSAEPVANYLGFDNGQSSAIAAADVDADADVDLLLGRSNYVSSTVHDGDLGLISNQGIPSAVSWVLPDETDVSGRYRSTPAFCDIDDDGDLDLFAGNYWGRISHYVNDGDDRSPNWTLVTDSYAGINIDNGDGDGLDYSTAAFCDVDADGDFDLFVGQHYGTITFFGNTGTAATAQWAAGVDDYAGIDVGYDSAPTFYDVDRDGDFDLFVGCELGTVVFYENTGSPESAQWTLRDERFADIDVDFCSFPVLADVDGDGDGDLFVGEEDGGLNFWRNTSPTLEVSPNRATLAADAQETFTVAGGTPSYSWSFREGWNNSGATIDENGVYTAGPTAGVMDCLEATDASGLIGRVYVNVIRPEDVAAAGKAIIVAGRGDDDPLWRATNHLANFAYDTLRYRGFSKNNIYYLSPDRSQDVDGNGLLDDVDATASVANVQYAFETWAADASVLTVYFVDHGAADAQGQGQFRLSPSEILQGSTVDGWLDTLQTDGCRVTVVIDCCESGSFLDDLAPPSGEERIIVASAGTDEPAYFIAGGLISFSEAFWNSIYSGYDVRSAFEMAADGMSRFQTPVLDDTGDGSYQHDDGQVAEQRHIGASYIAGSDRPQIGRISGNQVIDSGTEATIWADDVSGTYTVTRVWAVVVPPSFQSTPEEAVADLPEIELLYNQATERWEGTYDGFTEAGSYAVIIVAQDIWDSISSPKQMYVHQAGFDERVILIAGAGDYGDTATWEATDYLANYAYQTFRSRWFDDEHIRYLSVGNAQGVDAQPTLSAVEDAINTWAEAADRLTVYLVGRGESEGFRLNDTEVLTPGTLDGLLDSFQNDATYPDRRVTLILDASTSGAWLSDLAPPTGKERVMIASAPAGRNAVCAVDGRIAFSQFFLNYVFMGRNVRDSFVRTADATGFMSDGAVWHELDDNGNGVPNEKPGDGDLAQMTHIGSAFVTGSDLPQIGSVCEDAILYGTTSAALWAKDVSDADGISRVWAAIVPPHYAPEAGDTIGTVDLVYNEALGRYEAVYDGFDRVGQHTVLIYAEDTHGNLSVPLTATFEQAGPDEYEDDDTFHAATIAVLGDAAQTHNFHDAGDVDWAKFYGLLSVAYAIETSELGERADTVIELYDTDGITLLADKDAGSTGEDETLLWQCPAEGIYYVRVRHSDDLAFGIGTDYQLRAYGAGGPVTPVLTFETPSSQGREDVAAADLSVVLWAASSETVTVDYAVTGGTAAGGGVDYTFTPGTLVLDPGESVETISISIANDLLEEPGKTIEVGLSSPSNAIFGVNSSHTYTIVDNDRIPEETYRFERMWPTLQQPWYFDWPSGLAMDGRGNIYVADTRNQRVQKFTEDGHWVTSWGRLGSGEGEFDWPRRVAVDDQGLVYVTDESNHRVQKFTADGQFVAAWGSLGSANGQFGFPWGIAVDGDGFVYVADASNHRVQKFTANGEFMTTWGGLGDGEGEFDSPRGIAADSAGSIYVTDSHNDRVQKFTGDGEFVCQWPDPDSGDEPTLDAPADVAVDASGFVYVVNESNFAARVHKFTADGMLVAEWGHYGHGEGEFDTPCGIAIDGAGLVRVADSANQRIQKFTADGQFVDQWASSGSAPGLFYWPSDIATDSDGSVYAGDWGNSRIEKFTADGQFVTEWGSYGDGTGQFSGVYGVATDVLGSIYVSDSGHRIQKFSSDGEFLLEWGRRGSANGQFYRPAGIATDENGFVYVADSHNHRIQKFTAYGEFVTAWGTRGSDGGEFSYPRDIVADSSGFVYVTDTENHRVQKFAAEGEFVAMWGNEGSGNGEFVRPFGIAVDERGTVYVAERGNVGDPSNQRVQMFTSDGEFIAVIGEAGSAPGQLNSPSRLCMGEDGLVYVVDSYNGCSSLGPLSL